MRMRRLGRSRHYTEEARRWKGEPARLEEKAARRIASWPDLEIRQAGRGVLVRARTASFHSWWHDERMWQGDPLDPIIDWIVEEGESK